MALSTMYAGKNNSPKTSLSADITASAQSITVENASYLPTAPNLATLGTGNGAELILYSSVSGNTLNGVVRGVNGTTPSVWTAGTVVARNFTTADWDAIRNNIYDIDGRMVESADLGALAYDNAVDYTGVKLTNKPTLGSLASKNTASLATDVSGTLPIANGGTGSTSASDARTALGLGGMAVASDAPSDSTEYARKNGAWSAVTHPVATWGSITGTLSSQTDLNTALSAKANSADLGGMASVNDAPSDGSEYARKNGAWSAVTSPSPAWGSITGTLSSQTDLNTALSAKANTADLGTLAAVNDAPSDGSEYARKNGAWTVVTGGGGSGLPSGGTKGQVLAKASGADGDVGWYDIWNLPHEEWWLPTGLARSSVIAAWRFKGAISEAAALLDLTGNGYDLSKYSSSVTWNNAAGFYIPAEQGQGLCNAALCGAYSSTNAVIFGYSGYSAVTNALCGGYVPYCSKTVELQGHSGTAGGGHSSRPTMRADGNATIANSTAGVSGTMGANWASNNDVMYINGSAAGVTAWSATSSTPSRVLFGQIGTSSYTCCSFYISAAVLFNTQLTTAQHAELSFNIGNL